MNGPSSRILDNNGIHGSCITFPNYYEPLLYELSESRMHGAAMRSIRVNQVRNRANVQSRGQNHCVRRRWLWAHTLDAHGRWIGHASCIEKLTRTNKKTLTSIRNSYISKRTQFSVYPARLVLNNDDLL